MEYSKDLVDISCKIAASSLGYTSVKDEQLKVVSSFLAGKNIFAPLPAGYGKSLRYVLFDCYFKSATQWL